MSAEDLPTEFTLNNGLKIPAIGMGCWMGANGGHDKVEEMCRNAIKVSRPLTLLPSSNLLICAEVWLPTP